MDITKVVKPFIRRGWHNTFANIVYVQQTTADICIQHFKENSTGHI